MGGLSIPNNGLTDSALITMSASPIKSSPSFLLPAQLYKSLFANAILQKPAQFVGNGSDYSFPRNLLFSCEKSPNSREYDEANDENEESGCGEDSKKLDETNEKSEPATILWESNNDTGISTAVDDTLVDNNQQESTNQTINNSDNSGNNSTNNNNSGNTSSSDEEVEEESGEPDNNTENHIASEVNNNNAVTTDSNTTIGLVTLTGAPVLTSGTGGVGCGNTILQTNQNNPTQGLVHWMSAVMAEHINTNSHHDPTVGMHYMWNGSVDQCGQHNKEIEYGGWPGPRNHMAVKQGYEAKMTDHHNGLQKAHILDDGRIDHHTILQTQMPTPIYSATGALRSASSNSNSPGIGTHLPGTPAALLVVPQPINATKIGGSTNTTVAGNGTTRKNQTKKKRSTNKRSQVYIIANKVLLNLIFNYYSKRV